MDRQSELKLKRKIAELKTLKFYTDKFIMNRYIDNQVVPKQAKLLGFIRGMIHSNKKKKKMSYNGETWMKETGKKMAFMLGIGETTVKGHITFLVNQGYLKRGNYSEYLDNTNWYCIDEKKLEADFQLIITNLEEEINQLNTELKNEPIESEANDDDDDTGLLSSQNPTIVETESDSTILNNNVRMFNNPLELNENEFIIDDGLNLKSKLEIIPTLNDEDILTNDKLDKRYCFNELNSIFPNGWFDYLMSNGIESTLIKYDKYLQQYTVDELIEYFTLIDRLME